MRFRPANENNSVIWRGLHIPTIKAATHHKLLHMVASQSHPFDVCSQVFCVVCHAHRANTLGQDSGVSSGHATLGANAAGTNTLLT